MIQIHSGETSRPLVTSSLVRRAIDDRGTYERSTWTKSIKGLKSYKKKDTYILSPVRSHGQNSEPKDDLNSTECDALKALKHDTILTLKKLTKELQL